MKKLLKRNRCSSGIDFSGFCFSVSFWWHCQLEWFVFRILGFFEWKTHLSVLLLVQLPAEKHCGHHQLAKPSWLADLLECLPERPSLSLSHHAQYGSVCGLLLISARSCCVCTVVSLPCFLFLLISYRVPFREVDNWEGMSRVQHVFCSERWDLIFQRGILYGKWRDPPHHF